MIGIAALAQVSGVARHLGLPDDDVSAIGAWDEERGELQTLSLMRRQVATVRPTCAHYAQQQLKTFPS